MPYPSSTLYPSASTYPGATAYFSPSSTGAATTALALGAPTRISLAAAAGAASTSLALTARPLVGLAASAGIAADALKLRATTLIDLEAAEGTSSTSVHFATPTPITEAPTWAILQARAEAWEDVEDRWPTWEDLLHSAIWSDGRGRASLALTAPSILAFTTGGTSATALTLTARAKIALGGATGASTSALALHAPALLTLASSGGSTTALVLQAPSWLQIVAAGVASANALILTVRTSIEDRSWAALRRREPTWEATEAEWATWAELLEPPWPLSADGTSTTALALHAPAEVVLGPASGTATTKVSLHAPTRLILGRAEGVATSAGEFRTSAPITCFAEGTATSALSTTVRTFIEGKTWEGVERRCADWTAVQSEWATWAELLAEQFPIFSDGRASTTLRLRESMELEVVSQGTSSDFLHLTAHPTLELIGSHGSAETRLSFPGYKVRKEGTWHAAIHQPPLRVRTKGVWLPV